MFNDLQPGLVMAIEQFVRHLAGRALISQFQRFRTEPLNADDSDEAVWRDPSDGCVRLNVLEFHD
jgi:hypothetical protein